MPLLKNILFRLVPENIIIPIKKWHYLRKLRNFSEKEEDDLILLKFLVHEGDEAVDIGANIGIYTLFLSKYTGERGHVYAIEPVPVTFNILKNNIAKLGLHNVIPVNAAVSDIPGNAIMEIPRYEKAGDNYYEAKIVHDADPGLKTFEVKCTTLDELYRQFNFTPTFIKCDVEGYEWNVFKGAEKLLKNTDPVLLVEINQPLDNPDNKTAELILLLRNHNYNIYIKQGNGLKPWEGEKKTNYYFLKPSHVNKLKENIIIGI